MIKKCLFSLSLPLMHDDDQWCGGANEELNGNMSHWIEIFSISYSLLPFIVILHSIRGVYMECKQNDQKKRRWNHQIF